MWTMNILTRIKLDVGRQQKVHKLKFIQQKSTKCEPAVENF